MVLDRLFSSLGTYAAVATLGAVLLGLAVKLAGPVNLDLPPWPLFKFGLWLTRSLDAFRDALVPPYVRAIEIAFGYIRPQWCAATMQVLHALAALRIPDALQSSPKTAKELAPMVGVQDLDKLERLLRAAAAMRLLSVSGRSQAGAARYGNTAIAETLRETHPRSVRAMVCSNMEDCLPAYAQLVDGLRQDKVPFELHNDGLDFWEYLKRRPQQEAQFSAAMTAADVTGTPAIVADFAWGAYDRIIDVAGAHGAVLAAIMAAHPRLRGVLFDLPQVIERAKEEWRAKRSALLGRVEFVGGSFFDAATLPAPSPGSRDVFMLRCVLHDWNDAKTLDILRSLRTAIGSSKTATLVLVEVIPHSDLAHEDLPARQMIDMQMLVVVDGKERSRGDWEPLLSATGFKLRTIQPTRSAFRVLLADPV